MIWPLMMHGLDGLCFMQLTLHRHMIAVLGSQRKEELLLTEGEMCLQFLTCVSFLHSVRCSGSRLLFQKGLARGLRRCMHIDGSRGSWWPPNIQLEEGKKH